MIIATAMNVNEITTDGYLVTMPVMTLKRILYDAVRISHTEEEYISQNQAHARYGRRQVERWLEEGLISCHKDGDGNHKVRFSVRELEACASASNRTSFFNHKYNPSCKRTKKPPKGRKEPG